MSTARRRGKDELARPAGARDAGVALVQFEQRKTACRSHLDHGGQSIAEDAPLRVDLATKRIVHARPAQAAIRRRDERPHGSLAAVGERHLFDVRARPGVTDAARDGRSDSDRIGSYGSSTDSSGVVRILKDLDAPIEGRHVLVVEGIVDSGLTLSYLLRTLKARDPASLEAEWSELARLRADPNVFLTPDWIRVARAYDRREQITLWIAERGIAALALEDDGTISFAGGEYTDYQDVVAKPVDVPVVAESLAAWIAVRRSPRAIFEFVPEDSGTLDALSAGLGRAGYEVRLDRLVSAQ